MTDLSVATISGYEVPLTVFPSKAKTAGDTIVVLPALGMMAKFYRPLAEALATAGFNAVLFEQRGYGRSALRAGRESDFGYREWLEEDIPATLDWCRSQFAGTPVLLGHSLGGHLAACYAGLHPAEVHRLILPACGAAYAPAFPTGKRLQMSLLYFLIPVLNTCFGYFPGDKLGFGGRDARRLMHDWRQMVFHNRYAAEGMTENLDQHLARYPGQVLSLRYGADDMGPVAACDAVTGKMAAAQVETRLLDQDTDGHRYNHFTWARRPTLTVDAIRYWLTAPGVTEASHSPSS